MSDTGQQPNYTSEAPALSADGMVIAFVSSADNLVLGDSPNDCTTISGEPISCADIFVRDRAVNLTERISVVNGTPGFGESGVIDEWGAHVAVSADGHVLAFHSSADNLAPGCLEAGVGIFVVDRRTGAIECAARGIGATAANGRSVYPALSAEGRYVVFISEANNLVEGDTNGVSDIFVLDRRNQTLERVNVAGSGEQANAASDMFFGSPAISADGRFVVFVSYADNLTPDDDNQQPDIFLRDRLNSETVLLSRSRTGKAPNGEVFAPVISADGRFVAFHSDAANLVPGDTNGSSDVFVLEPATGTLERVSISSGGAEGNDRSTGPLLSGDGRWVAFSSLADNLVPGDTNKNVDAFVHDRQTGMTYRVSVGANGVEGNGPSIASAMAENGCCIAIWSMADNWIEGDTNGVWDIFLISMARQ
mgnify:CR=1 FL=1